MIAKALAAMALCLITAGAGAQQTDEAQFAAVVSSIAEIGYTGGAAVQCGLRPREWGRDLYDDSTAVLRGLTQKAWPETDQGRHFYQALKQLRARVDNAKNVTPADCLALRDSPALTTADAIVNAEK